MKQIILFPKCSLSKAAIRKLDDAGACAIEVDDPSKIVMLMPSSAHLSGDMIIKAAVYALGNASFSSCREDFAKSLIKQLAEKPLKQTSESP